MATKPKKHYVDNERFFNEILEYKKKVKTAKEQGLEKPRVSEYMGSCILMIAERLSTKPRFMNYSFREEMISDALENCFLYFDNFDPEKSHNPFAYFTQIIYYAFHRRISKEEKNRYIIYKKFQESVLDTSDASLMIDSDDNHLVSTTVYDNINDFIGKFEKRESEKKLKRKQVKQGLENFVGEDDEAENQFEVPFQVQTLISSLKDRKERVHIRGNYRMRLEGIRQAIDSAINEYDMEMGTANTFGRRKSNGR